MKRKFLERSPSELNRGRDCQIGFDLLEDCRRAKEAAGMALSDDLRERVVGAVVEGGMSRNAAAKRFGVSIASAVRWVARFKAKGEISPAPTGGDRRSGRIEAHRDYLLGLIRRRPDMTLLEMQERLIANCGERFSSSVLWRFFDRHEITFKKSPRMPRSSNARTGVVTLPCGEREASAPQELSGHCDCGPPRGHRRSAKRAVRLGGDEMALDVEGIVDGGVCGKKFLG